MKSYDVQTTVHTNSGKLYIGDPVTLNEKELEKISEAVNTRQAIRITNTKDNQINQKFFPLSSLDHIEVLAKETGENH